jgi:ankyrin repeat protein
MKTYLASILAASVLTFGSLYAQTPPELQSLLRDALYEEEARRDFTKAAASYESLLAKWAEQRPLAAAATFRLAEVRRKQDRKDDAIALYQRLVREFSDIEPHAKLSRENLVALGAAEPSSNIAAAGMSDEEIKALSRLQKLAQESPDLLVGREFSHACGEGWLEVVQFLLSVKVQDDGAGFVKAAENGHLAVIRELLPSKPKAATLNTALAAAAGNGRTSVAQVLLDSGANPNSPEGESSLDKAIDGKYADLVDLLIARKASPMAKANVFNPLLRAIAHSNAPLVKRLIELGADVNFLDFYQPRNNPKPPGWGTPIYAAGKVTPIMQAALVGQVDIVKMLLEAKADPKMVNEELESPLSLAIENLHPEVVRLLLAAGASPEPTPRRWSLQLSSLLPLRAVTSNPSAAPAAIEILQLLVAAKAPLTHSDVASDTVFTYAMSVRDPKVREQILEILLSGGAEMAVTQLDLHTPTRVKLIRAQQYPKLAAEAAISLCFPASPNECIVRLEQRDKADDAPGKLADLLLDWSLKSSAKDDLKKAPDWSLVRIWRKEGANLKPIEWAPKLSQPLPSLQWGDVVEVLCENWETLEVTGGSLNSRDRRLSVELEGLLSATRSAKITLHSDGVTKDLTLRGHLRSYDINGTDAPFVSMDKLLPLVIGNRKGEVKIERQAAHGGGVATFSMDQLPVGNRLMEGDVVSFTEENQGNRVNWPGVYLRVAGQPGCWRIQGGSSVTLAQCLVSQYAGLGLKPQPELPKHDLQKMTPDELATNMLAGNLVEPTSLQLAWPDWSKVKIHRYKKEKSEPEIMDLRSVMESLTDQSTAEAARKHDVTLNKGDEVELTLLAEHPAGAWPGLDAPAARFLAKAVEAKATIREQNGNFREVTMQWLPPRWVATPAGVLPIAKGEAVGGRVHDLSIQALIASVAPNSELDTDQMPHATFVDHGMSIPIRNIPPRIIHPTVPPPVPPLLPGVGVPPQLPARR